MCVFYYGSCLFYAILENKYACDKSLPPISKGNQGSLKDLQDTFFPSHSARPLCTRGPPATPKPLIDLVDKSSYNPPNQPKLHLPGRREALPDWQGDRGGASEGNPPSDWCKPTRLSAVPRLGAKARTSLPGWRRRELSLASRGYWGHVLLEPRGREAGIMTGEVDSEVGLGSGLGCGGLSLRAGWDRRPSRAGAPSRKDYSSRRAPL